MKAIPVFEIDRNDSRTSLLASEIITREAPNYFHGQGINFGFQTIIPTSRVDAEYNMTTGTAVYDDATSTAIELFPHYRQNPLFTIWFGLSPSKAIYQEPVQVSVLDNSTYPFWQNNKPFENPMTYILAISSDYVDGYFDIPDIVRLFGPNSSENSAALLLESLGAYRPINMVGLLGQEKDKVLEKLAQIRASTQAEEFNETNWILREVMASQRIESVNVSPEYITKT